MKWLTRLLRLMPLLVTLAAAIASCFVPLAAGIGRDVQTLDLLAARGRMHVAYVRGEPNFADTDYARVTPAYVARMMDHWRPSPPKLEHRVLDAKFTSTMHSVGRAQVAEAYHVVVPFWILGLIASTPVWPLVWRSARRRQRVRDGLCGTCGYDLRHTADRCPECGAAVAAAATSPATSVS